MRERRFRKGWLVLGIIIVVLIATGTGAASERTSITQEDLQPLLDVIRLLESKYIGDVDKQKVIQGAIEGVMRNIGDPYSEFMAPDQYDKFLQGLEGSFSGVGLYLQYKSGRVSVVAPLVGTPADRAGIKPGDVILAVDNISVIDKNLEEVVRLIRGPDGTKVTLTLQRQGVDDPIVVELVREKIELHTVTWRVIEGNFGYVLISSFGNKTAEEFRRAIEELKANQVRGLVIDLRNNPGGLLQTSVEVADEIVPEGPIVYIKQKEGEKITIRSGPNAIDLPMVMLINGGTASGAEIVAGAAKDYMVAKLVGTRTFGKGAVQTVVPFGSLGALRFTVAEYFTPTGQSLEDVGIQPDVLVENPEPPGKDAMQALKIDRPISRGAIGLDVLALQKYLNLLGFDAGPEDGIYGPQTEAAVKRAQSSFGLKVTGKVDQSTVASINKKLESLTKPTDEQLSVALKLLRELADQKS